VIGGDENVRIVGEAEFAQRVLQPLEIVVGIPDCGARCRSVDAGRQFIEAVAVAVLRPIRIARPINQHEWLIARLEHWKDNLGRYIGEISLLYDVGDRRAGRLKLPPRPLSPRPGVATGRPAEASAALISSDNGMPLFVPVEIVKDDRLLAGALGMVEMRTGPSFPMAAVLRPALRAAFRIVSFLVEVVAAEHLIDLAEDAIILEKRCHAVAGGSNRTANIDDIAEITGVA